MANTERTTKQKILLVVSIIEIVLSALMLIMGLMAIAGASLLLNETSMMIGEEQVTGAQASGLAGIAGALLIGGAIFGLLTGIFGIRGANDASKTTPYIVCAAISLVLGIVTLFTGGFSLNGVIDVIPDALLLWLGVSIRNEGFGDVPRGEA